MLILKNASFCIDEKFIFKKTNLTVNPYEIVSIVGKNGAGKTTLFEMICGLIQVSEGEIYFFNKQPNEETYFQELFFIPDIPLVHEYLNGREYIEFIAALYNKKIDKNDVENILTFFELESKKNQLIREYSKGMKVKVAIAAALLIKPKLLILDEPFNGLDPTSCIKLMEALKEFSKLHGSVLLSSHTLDLVEQVSDKIYHLNNHKLENVTDYNLRELFSG